MGFVDCERLVHYSINGDDRLINSSSLMGLGDTDVGT